MAKGYGRKSGKSGGLTGNTSKLGGKSRKLALKTDMREDNLVHSNFKRASKQAHKRA